MEHTVNTVPHKLLWSPPRDAILMRLRGEGCSWDAIAGDLRVSRNAAIERGRRLGARLPPRPAAVRAVVEDPDRPCLPPGHLISWGALVGGTLLADEPYPVPPPIGRERPGVIGELR